MVFSQDFERTTNDRPLARAVQKQQSSDTKTALLGFSKGVSLISTHFEPLAPSRLSSSLPQAARFVARQSREP